MADYSELRNLLGTVGAEMVDEFTVGEQVVGATWKWTLDDLPEGRHQEVLLTFARLGEFEQLPLLQVSSRFAKLSQVDCERLMLEVGDAGLAGIGCTRLPENPSDGNLFHLAVLPLEMMALREPAALARFIRAFAIQADQFEKGLTGDVDMR